jgi:hypothetical protein
LPKAGSVASKGRKASRDKRDGSTFALLPLVMLESAGYRAASHTARSLLVDMAKQYTGRNNGTLTACVKYLAPLGWRSNDVIVRARRELIDCCLILETRKGARPNRAGWYALTWLDLDVTEGLDIDPKLYERCFRRGYLRPDIAQVHGASLAPRGGVAPLPIAPSDGVGCATAAPRGGAIRLANGSGLHRGAVRI